MRYVAIEASQSRRAAVVVGEELIDLTAVLGPRATDVAAVLALGAQARARIERYAREGGAPRLALRDTKHVAPLASPGKVLGVGMSYRSFVAAVRRANLPLATERLWFCRPAACVAGPYDEVPVPEGALDLDYEGELAVVIGCSCRRVPVAQAPAVIGGFTVANDLTLRSQVSKSIVFAKSFDSHTPLGPCVVTPDEIGDPQALRLQTWVNGVLRQDSTTADMLASCHELIAEVSALLPLHAGDVILTGTPAGVGAFQEPPAYLRAGDIVRVEIEGIGAIENPLVAEPPGGGSPAAPSLAAHPVNDP